MRFVCVLFHTFIVFYYVFSGVFYLASIFVPSQINTRFNMSNCLSSQKNPDGQTMLASTLIPQPQSMTHASVEEDVNMSFGRSICSFSPAFCSLFFHFVHELQ